MCVIIEVERPYTDEVLEPLVGESVLIVDGHSYWCASSGIRRMVFNLMQGTYPERLADSVWLCRELNTRAISEALKIPHRYRRIEIYHLRKMLTELRSQQAALEANPQVADMMDDPTEITRRIGVLERRLEAHRPDEL